tara:strand:+ start:645 stop:1502 length:858 start_codon:yes stop_codon:yes gene_type:complete
MISIVIVNFNSSDYLKRLINSILTLEIKVRYELIVIDNNSDVPFNLKPDKRIRLIYNNSNIGFANAVNKGISHAQGDKILLLNPDVIIENKTIDILSSSLDNNPDYGVVGCKVLNKNHTYQVSSKRHFPTYDILCTKFFRLDKIFYKTKIFGKYNYTYMKTDKVAYVDSVSGCCMMFRKNIISKVGIFDERFFLYFEDTDFCLRVKDKGYKIVYVPETKIIHFKSRSFINSNINKNLEFFKSFYIFFDKYDKYYKNYYFVKKLFKILIKTNIFLLKIMNPNTSYE